ncbi:MAG: M20/M25/M40 family metallo-hydrolase [Pirellulaceae bacterium]
MRILSVIRMKSLPWVTGYFTRFNRFWLLPQRKIKMIPRTAFTTVVVLALCLPAAGQAQLAQVRSHIHQYREAHAVPTIELLREFMELPNVSADQADVRRNAEFLVDQFSRRGAQMELLEVPGGNPVVYGEIDHPQAERTVLIYAHYDGQPVNPGRWQTTQPFVPALYSKSILAGGSQIPWPQAGEAIDPEWRIYGRSASDDKAPFVALLTALDALASGDIELTSNIKFFFDGEEEIGSPNMERVLSQHRDKFADVDLWVFCDGPLHQSGQPTLYYGVRGITALEVTLFGANRNLHSGHYGNWAPNPGMQLAQLLASMKDDHGNVLVDGFYDDVLPLSEAEQQSLNAIPAIDDQLRKELGLLETENDNAAYLQRMQLPSFNVRGLECATVGRTARNVVPNTATASIDIRLVKGNHPERMLRLVEQHIERQGYFITRQPPTAAERQQHARIAMVTRKIGYPAARTAMDHPAVQPLVESLTGMIDKEQQLLQIPGLGGSLPLYLITEGEQKPLVILPLANYDNNQHAPDENLRLGNFWYGIDAMTAILAMP